jgi:3',5'-cyclic AMP phosphodiesterase CpdA
LKIAVFTDAHVNLAAEGPENNRYYHLAEGLIGQLVDDLNQSIRPDAVVCAGDLLDRGGEPEALNQYRQVRGILDRLDSPFIAIPGNHDGPDYNKVFGSGTAFIHDIMNVRFALFRDPERAGYNATREEESMLFMEKAAGHEGPLVSLQHVPLFPEGTTDCPYNYTNSGQIITALQTGRYCLALSGHYHEGFDYQNGKTVRYHATAALCEPPFCFDVITFSDSGIVSIQQHNLSGPS